MADDVALNKLATIERCLSRIREEYPGHEQALETDFTAFTRRVLRSA